MSPALASASAYLHEAFAAAESDHGADELGVDLVEEEVEPGDVVVVDDVQAVLHPVGAVQLLAESVEHLLELVLGCVCRPCVHPVLDYL